MAERHDVQHILKVARELVHKVQSLMDNKWQKKGSVFLSSLRKTELFLASTFPELFQGVQVCSLPRWRPLVWCQSTSEVAQLSTSASICLHVPFVPSECPCCLSRHVELSACLLVWSHCESILRFTRFSSACVRAWKHTHTHTHTLLQFSRLPPFSWLWPCRVPEKMFRILGGAASLPRRGSHKWPNGLCQLPDRECFLQACVFLAPLSSFFVLFFFKKSSFSHKCCLYEKQPEVLSCTFWWAFPSGRRWRPHRVGGGGGGTTARIALGCKEWTALSATWWPRHVYSLFQVRINRQSTNWRKKSTLSETIYRWGFEIRSALCIYLKVTFKPNSLILCQHLYIYVITVGISC